MHWKRAVWLVKHNLSTKLLSLHLAFFVYQHLVDKFFFGFNESYCPRQQAADISAQFSSGRQVPSGILEEWNDALIIMAGSFTRSIWLSSYINIRSSVHKPYPALYTIYESVNDIYYVYEFIAMLAACIFALVGT